MTLGMPKPEDLADVRDGAVLQNMLPYARVEIDGMMRAVVNNVMSLVQSGCLTPEIAQQKWIEYVSYARLLQRFEQKVRVSQDKGRVLNGTGLTFAQ